MSDIVWGVAAGLCWLAMIVVTYLAYGILGGIVAALVAVLGLALAISANPRHE
jgi:hypothetical protein